MHLKVSRNTIIKYLKHDLGLSYKKVSMLGLRHNIASSKLQRQHAAYHYLSLMAQGVNIINIDESILSQTDFRKKGWSIIGQPAYTQSSQRLSRVSIIGAVSSKGHFYYTVNLGANNSEKIWLFMLKLITHLESQDQLWRSKTVLMLDNAPYHRSKWLLKKFEEFKVPIMFLGPY